MNYKEVEIYDGIKLHLIQTDKFKTDFIGIFLVTDLSRETVTQNALIPAVLSRGTENLPTMKEINIKLEEMYGCICDSSIDKVGERQILQFYTSSISNAYIDKREDLLAESIDLISDIILKPKLENGIFSDTYVAQEKETLKNLIEGRINNKDVYATTRCIEIMCKEEDYHLFKYGYVEDLASITAKELYQRYLEILKTVEIHIYISGNFNEEEAIQKIKERFKIEGRAYQKLAKKGEKLEKNKPVEYVKETQDVNQGKLVLGLRVDTDIYSDEAYQVLVHNVILGGSSNSKLFQNVREKASLAYYARAAYVKHKGILLISSGIEIANYDKALSIIQEQIADMKAGNFSEEDIKDAKMYLSNGYQSFLDEQTTLIDFYMAQQLLGLDLDMKTVIDKMNQVTKEEIVQVANKISLETVYFLTGKGEME